MENNSTSTFWQLSEKKISIPIIQRDYAQGRDNEFDKRDKFLSKIESHLDILNKPLNLDFVYGRIKDNIFYPIDGQQRLTTLYLLHWYISLKEGVAHSEREKLIHFTYDTRISSREFCHSIINQSIEIPDTIGDDSFKKNIKDSHWYRANWEFDSTICGMLNMIQCIHDKFYQTQNNLWERLCNNRIVSFQLLDLGAEGFELTDELYIKMNARGKQLNSFENFKATFIQFINLKFPNQLIVHEVRGKISYADYFAFRIEKEWTDLFWANRGEAQTIDNYFGNFFDCISQLLFFKHNLDAKTEDFISGFLTFEKIYGIEENLLFLFNSIDKIYEIHCIEQRAISNLFQTIFTYRGNETKYPGKLNLFGESKKGVNLFRSIIKQGVKEDVRNQMLFYSILHYLIKFELNQVNDGLQSYCRLIRNLLQAVRQRNDVKYNSDVRMNRFGSYWKLFEQLATEKPYDTLRDPSVEVKGLQITERSLLNERIKAEIICEDQEMLKVITALEELPIFGGLIHQLKPIENKEKLKDYHRVLINFWNDNVEESIKVRSLLMHGFDGLLIKNSKMGEMYYFGQNHNWDIILTSNDAKISTAFVALLSNFSISSNEDMFEKSKNEIKLFLLEKEVRDWRYYFIKYPSFLSQNNYFVWSKNEFEIRSLGGTSSNPLVSFHINPYVLSVAEIINDINIVDFRDCRQQYSGYSPLITKNGFSMKPILEGWEITVNGDEIDLITINKYKLEKREDIFLLRESELEDRVEIAVNFIKEFN